MRLLTQAKQSMINTIKSWGIFSFWSDDFAEIAPVHGLKIEKDTKLGVEAQYDDIHQILGDLDRTMTMVEMIKYKGMTQTGNIKGLRKMGPTVVNLDSLNDEAQPEPIDMERLPVMVFLATRTQQRDLKAIGRGHEVAVFMYGLKMNDSSVNTDPDAALYLVGEYYVWKGGSFWSAFYVTIKDGSLRCLSEVDGKRQPWLEQFSKNNNYSYEKGLRDTERICAIYFNVWQRRDSYWRFSAHSPEARVTFLINPKDPKRIFADRKVKAKTKTGKKKTIIHYVTGHYRNTRGKRVWINAHLRGLRNFYWGNAYCTVLAPFFHRFNTDDFKCAGDDMAKPMQKKPDDYVHLEELADILVKGESSQDLEQVKKVWERKKGGKVYRKLKRRKLREKMASLT